MAANSAGVCHWPSGDTFRIFSAAHFSYSWRWAGGRLAWLARQTDSFRSVFTIPGERALTRTPWGARSLAAHCTKLISPALAALYGGSVCEPIWPATDTD